jgi:hypothetical protein
MATRRFANWAIGMAPAVDADPAEPEGRSQLVMGLWLPASPLVMPLAVVVYAVAEGPSVSAVLRLVGVGVMASSAAWLLGGLVGFLFGLPRTVERVATTTFGSVTPDFATPSAAPEAAVTPSQTSATRAERRVAPALMRTNTNLEEISDWLTKILVGLGLVQLGAFVTRLDHSGAALASGLGNGTGAKPFALGLLIYGLIDGFLFGYLWTRTVASLRLKGAEEALQRTLVRDEMIASLTNSVLAAPPPPAPPTTLPPPPPSGGEAPPRPPAQQDSDDGMDEPGPDDRPADDGTG